MRQGAHFGGAAIEQIQRIPQGRAFSLAFRVVKGDRTGHLDRHQILADSIVQLAGNAAALLILDDHDVARKMLEF